jgi:hypothetical protein
MGELPPSLTDPGASLAALVADADQDLLALSDEQYHALWADRWIEADPGLIPLMDVVLRTLEAAGHAERRAGASVPIGAAAFLHDAHQTQPGVVVHTAAGPRACLVPLEDGALLSVLRAPTGIGTVVLGRATRAVRRLVTEVTDAGEPAGEPEPPPADVADLVARSRRWSAWEPRPAGTLPAWLVDDLDPRRTSLLLGRLEDGSLWAAEAGEGGTEVRRVDRREALALARRQVPEAGGPAPLVP